MFDIEPKTRVRLTVFLYSILNIYHAYPVLFQCSVNVNIKINNQLNEKERENKFRPILAGLDLGGGS